MEEHEERMKVLEARHEQNKLQQIKSHKQKLAMKRSKKLDEQEVRGFFNTKLHILSG